jgi:hypothetical protein
LCDDTADLILRDILAKKLRITTTITDGAPATVARDEGVFHEFVAALRQRGR